MSSRPRSPRIQRGLAERRFFTGTGSTGPALGWSGISTAPCTTIRTTCICPTRSDDYQTTVTENTRGFLCLTWRLGDAVEAKMAYIAKAPWDSENKLSSSRTVYHDYAQRSYGAEVSDEVTDIINEKEAYAGNASECEGTPEFSGKSRDG